MLNEHLLALLDTDRHRLVRAATRLLGPADAEDAVQDAYIRALEADVPELNAAQAWLLTVVRNLAIDRLRRRSWMQQWLLELNTDDAHQAVPSAEMDAALAQQARRALRMLAAHLTPVDAAVLLLHEVFEVAHAEIAEASGRTEASSRQQLRRALLKLRHAVDAPEPELAPGEETVFRLYLQSLQLRDPQTLWSLLRRPPISALAAASTQLGPVVSAPPATQCGVVQVAGQLGLVLSLDGVQLCVLPLGVRPTCALDGALL